MGNEIHDSSSKFERTPYSEISSTLLILSVLQTECWIAFRLPKTISVDGNNSCRYIVDSLIWTFDVSTFSVVRTFGWQASNCGGAQGTGSATCISTILQHLDVLGVLTTLVQGASPKVNIRSLSESLIL